MARYRKRPVEVDAILWTGTNQKEIGEFVDEDLSTNKNVQLMIPTLEGTMYANVGDYIIRGVQGEYYPCKPDIFVKTYEEVV